MVLEPREHKFGDISLKGISNAGVGTSIVWPNLKLCFDVAQGLPFAYNMKQYLITHIHMDHAGGLPYIISQKAMTGQAPPQIYMPQSAVGPMETILKAWQKAEGHNYDYHLIGAEEDTVYDINSEYCFKTFFAHHRVDANGYTVFRKKNKLKSEFQSASRKEIIDFKESGKEVTDQTLEPILSFTGDTKIEFLDGPEYIRKSKILLVEVTYIDESRTVEKAREWGHIHLDELLSRLPALDNEKIVLIHLSLRHRKEDLKKKLKALLSPEDLERFVVW